LTLLHPASKVDLPSFLGHTNLVTIPTELVGRIPNTFLYTVNFVSASQPYCMILLLIFPIMRYKEFGTARGENESKLSAPNGHTLESINSQNCSVICLP